MNKAISGTMLCLLAGRLLPRCDGCLLLSQHGLRLISTRSVQVGILLAVDKCVPVV